MKYTAVILLILRHSCFRTLALRRHPLSSGSRVWAFVKVGNFPRLASLPSTSSTYHLLRFSREIWQQQQQRRRHQPGLNYSPRRNTSRTDGHIERLRLLANGPTDVCHWPYGPTCLKKRCTGTKMCSSLQKNLHKMCKVHN